MSGGELYDHLSLPGPLQCSVPTSPGRHQRLAKRWRSGFSPGGNSPTSMALMWARLMQTAESTDLLLLQKHNDFDDTSFAEAGHLFGTRAAGWLAVERRFGYRQPVSWRGNGGLRTWKKWGRGVAGPGVFTQTQRLRRQGPLWAALPAYHHSPAG